jgi:type 1 glutamine amidotransferase
MMTNHRMIALAVLGLLACAKEKPLTAGGTGGGVEDTGGSGGGATPTGGSPGTGGAKGTGGSPVADAGPSSDTALSPDTGTASPDVAAGVEAGPARVLIYTKTSGTVHVNGIAGAVTSFKAGLGGMGITVDTANDPMVFSEANLARYAGVIMVSTSGAPFGTPGTAQIDALIAFVKKGGGLAGFHAASSTDYGATSAFTALLGAETKDQGGGFRMSDCFPEGSNPSVAKVTMPWRVANEEFYTFNGFNPANMVVLRCNANTGTEKIPISWVRQEGAGRVFFTGLGHYPQFWAQGESFFTNHALPGVLWTIGR